MSSADENQETFYDSEADYTKTSWIYHLNKTQLQDTIKDLNLNYQESDNVEKLRKILRKYFKSYNKSGETPRANTTIAMANYTNNIQAFDGNNWEAFEQQLDCVLLLNEVKEEKKVPLLLTKVTPKVFDILLLLCAPRKPSDCTYKELCIILKHKFVVVQSPALDRAEFRRRNQLQGETIEGYVLSLQKLGSKCGFADLEDQIKEKLIDGVSSKLIKFELLKSASELTLDQTVQLAKTVEAALLHSGGDKEATEMFYVQQPKQKKHQFSKSKNEMTNHKRRIICYCCGKNNHVRSECRLSDKFCSECGKKGHIFRMCRQQTANMVEIEDSPTTEAPSVQVDTPKEDYEIYSINRVSRVAPHYLTVTVNDYNLPFQLDTGSEVTVISAKDKEHYLSEFSMQNSNVMFKNFDQTISRPLGIVNSVPVKFNNILKTLNVFVVQENCPRIVGRDWLNELGLWPPKMTNIVNVSDTSLSNVSDATLEIKKRFAAVFSPGWGNFKGEAITLKLKPDEKPKCLPVRRVPFALRDKVKDEIFRLIKNGRISPAEHSAWGTPIVPILKSDGSVRLCGDYKQTVNPYLEVDHFPLPHLEDIFEILKNGEYYCELDLKEAYLQAPISGESQDCTTIVTEIGTYKYNYLPYGVSTGPGSFQRLMAKKLENIPHTIVFIDNIYITGKTIQDTVDTLSNVLTKLQDCEFKLKPEKCKLFTKSIDVFGFRVQSNGISVIKSNIEPLLQTKPPTNITLLRSFLGKLTYYSRFLKDMATVITPLYECTKKDSFKWTPECETAFQKIKQKLCNVSSLSHFRCNQPLILTCDASSTGLGAVLSNRDENKVIKPIAYASKKLSDVEQKYSAIDKEAMAIVFGVTKFYNYLYGRYFELETDSAALVRIFGPKKSIPKMAAKRLQHYAIFLSAFQYEIRYIKTTINPADYLSRSSEYLETESIEMHSICNSGNISNIYNIMDSKMESINWETIKLETIKDPILSRVYSYMIDGWPNKKRISNDILPFYNKLNELSIDRGCLFWGLKIIIPTQLREAVLTELHRSHFGIVRMKQIARSYFWWPNLDATITDITKNCMVCLQNSNNPQKTLNTWPAPPSAWYRIHADFLGPFYNKMFLVIVDSYSKWPEVFEMNNITAGRTIEAFKNVYSRFGFPIHLVTDNGPTFTSSEFKNFCTLTNVKHTFSPPPYHPATNGAAERFVETFKASVTKIKESGHNLSFAVNLFLSDYRASPQRTTNTTPARLMLGREIRNRFNLLLPPPLSVVGQNDHVYAIQNKRKTQFQIGQKVMVRDYRRGSKPWVLGVVTEESIPGVTYVVDVAGCSWKRHVNQMLTCSESIGE